MCDAEMFFFTQFYCLRKLGSENVVINVLPSYSSRHAIEILCVLNIYI